ncbi:MAG: GNAT family N-acetyltransferase [Bacteroidales bacterium]
MVESVPSIETPRLRLRSFREDDLPAYAALCADPEVMRYVRGHAIDRPEAWREMALFLGHWALRGYGMWAVEERASGALVGRIGLHYPDGWPEREVGWALAREVWGRGYATEGCRAALDYAFRSLGWPRIISLIHPDNERSKRLALRVGMQFETQVVVRDTRVDLFALTARS